MTRPTVTIALHESRLLLVDPWPFVLIVGMPLALVPFLTGGLLGGTVTAIPGLTALFGFLGISAIGLAFFRDHGWLTWNRLRVSGVPIRSVVIGKSLPLLVIFVAQQVLLLLVGWSLLGMPWRGSLVAGALLVLTVAVTEVSLGLLITAYATSIQQVIAFTNLGGLLLAGFGGALGPLTVMPDWIQRVSPVSPVYWALKGLRGVIALGWDIEQVAQPLAILCGFCAIAILLTFRRYRHDESKRFFA